MAIEHELYVDVINRRLVVGINDKGSFSIPSFYQGDQIVFRVWFLKPTNSALAPFFTKCAIDNFTLKMHIGERAGTEALKASQTTWTKVYDIGASGTGYLTATFDLNTSDLNTLVGTSHSITSFFELKLSESGVERTVWQQSVTIIAVVQGPGSSAALPSPAADYYTKTEMLALLAQFVKFAGNSNGATVTLASPDGARTRIIGCNNDGSAKDDLT